jgi:hypothetical protein
MWKHGKYTREAVADRRMLAALVAECRAMVKTINEQGGK